MDYDADNGKFWAGLRSTNKYYSRFSKNKLIIISSEEDIMKLSDECVAKEAVVYCYPVIVDKSVDPKLMLKHGLFPRRSIAMVHARATARWKYSPIDVHHKNAIQKCDSYYLMYVAPFLLYNISKRPINNMLMYRSPDSHTLSTITSEWSLIPVTRYAAGMSKGLYYETTCDNFCGTFYYKEPESTTYLAYQKSFTAFNKTDAYLKLGGTEDIKTFFGTSFGHEVTMKMIRYHIDGIIPADLMMTKGEIQSIINDLAAGNGNTDDEPGTQKIYATDLQLYAEEDGLDQPLCILARDQGYDIVVLTNMVGSHQVVTEVLDTRSRVDSYRSLVYTV